MPSSGKIRLLAEARGVEAKDNSVSVHPVSESINCEMTEGAEGSQESCLWKRGAQKSA